MLHVIRFLPLLILTTSATFYEDDAYYDQSSEENNISTVPTLVRQEKKGYLPINHLTISDFVKQTNEPTTRSWYKPSRVNFRPEGRQSKPSESEVSTDENLNTEVLEEFGLFPEKPQEHKGRENRQTSPPAFNKKVSNTTIIWLHTTPMRTGGNPTPSPALLDAINTIAQQIKDNLPSAQANSTAEPPISSFNDRYGTGWAEEITTLTQKGTATQNLKPQADKSGINNESPDRVTTETWWPTRFVYAKPTTVTPLSEDLTLGTQPNKLLETKIPWTTLKPTRRPPNNAPPSEQPMFTAYTKPPSQSETKLVSFSPFLVMTEKKEETPSSTIKPILTTTEPEMTTGKRINLINIIETTTTKTTTTQPTTKATKKRRRTTTPASLESIVVESNDLGSNNEIDDYVYVNIWNLVNGKLRLAGQQKIPSKLFNGFNFKDGDMFQASDIPTAVMKVVDQSTTEGPPTIEVTSSSLKVSEQPTKSPTLLGQGSIKTLPPSIVVHGDTALALSNLQPNYASKVSTGQGSIAPIEGSNFDKGVQVSTHQGGLSPKPVLVVRPEPVPQLSEFPSGIQATTSRPHSTTRRQRPRTRTTTQRNTVAGSQHLGTTAGVPAVSTTTRRTIQRTQSTSSPQQTRRTTTSSAAAVQQNYLQALIENQLNKLTVSQLQKLISDPTLFNGTHLTISGSLPLDKVSKAIASNVVAVPDVGMVNSFMETSAKQEAAQTVPIQTVRTVPVRVQKQSGTIMTKLTSGLSNLGSGNKVVLGFAAVPSALMAFPYVAPMLGRKKRDIIFQTKQEKHHKTINIVPNGYEHLVHQMINSRLETQIIERVKRQESEAENRDLDYYDDEYEEEPPVTVSSLLSPFLSEKDKSGQNPTTLIPIIESEEGSKPIVVDISPFLAKRNMTDKQYYQLFLPSQADKGSALSTNGNKVGAGSNKKKNTVKQQMDDAIVVENSDFGGTVSDAASPVADAPVRSNLPSASSILGYFPYYAIPLIALAAPFALLASGRKKRSIEYLQEGSTKRSWTPIPDDLTVFQKYK